MKKLFVFLLLINVSGALLAQGNTGARNEAWKNIYRETAEKSSDLVHTKLDVKFDYAKKHLLGKAWITLKPHFYATDSVRLDAKGMDIQKVAILKAGKAVDVKYSYTDAKNLRVKLDRIYKSTEPYTLYIAYTARPDDLVSGGSAAITSDKGLFFINPSGADSSKPIQIWTQGETEASSVWFPTIDRPNQKTTQEISMTVPAKYVSLSNGKLVSQKKNMDGTRTDVWKMELPHAPYLFFMGVGEYAVVKDTYKGKEVNYYVEKEYEKVARKIFGNTPEMMRVFSEKLGVEFPWVKYAQIVGRDYVSGAMENTTATLFGDFVQQNARELVDNNAAEDVISHELFHQWFGDLVTAESWSNLTVNESFATYGEVIWVEHKLGKEAAQHKNYIDIATYLGSRSDAKDLVRFHYRDKEDMFDRVSYSKGGGILNMLRNVVGDDAFYKSLNLYLTRHKFKSAEAHDLRLAFEEVSGKDLSWFFNEWYFGAGHPKFDITYGYNDAAKMATVTVKQTPDSGKLFRMPVAIDVYEGKKKTRHQVWIENRVDSFSFAAASKPDLINFDGDKILIAEKKENKTIYEYTFQYNNAGNYVDKREAIDYAAKRKDQAEGRALIISALQDSYYEIRERALENIDTTDLNAATIAKIEKIARQDAKRLNRAAAINILGDLKNPKYADFFLAGTKDSSYTVAGTSLVALAEVDEQKALAALPSLQKDMKGTLKAAVGQIAILTKTDADFTEMTTNFDKASGYEKFNQFGLYLTYLRNVNNLENFKQGVDKIVAFRTAMSAFNPRIKDAINEQLNILKSAKLAKKNDINAAALDAQAAYIAEQVKTPNP